MIYCFICKDGPDAPQLRQTHLKAHLEHVEKVIDHIPVAGPIADKEGTYYASLVMIEAETEQRDRLGDGAVGLSAGDQAQSRRVGAQE